jgi:hypothetical protein
MFGEGLDNVVEIGDIANDDYKNVQTSFIGLLLAKAHLVSRQQGLCPVPPAS